ncbi:MAG: FKBP-type peptidyl-prolyl cis-trans isomerase [Planctomycetes bacterium]|nr:FKBP-type peptidyl-prolyl cis-trans isomerase [Planctomycetota bacterium]
MNPSLLPWLALVTVLATACGDSTPSKPSAPAPAAPKANSSPEASAPATATPSAAILAPMDAAPLRTLDLGEALLVDVLREGTGKVARATSTVALHYEGRTETGDEPFVSTRGRYQAERFELDPASDRRPIEGLARALVGLAPGARVRVHVPGHLAYGKAAVREFGIDEHADLLFDVELVEVR